MVCRKLSFTYYTRFVDERLTEKRERKITVDACRYFVLANTEYVRKINVELYPGLQNFAENETTLYNAT